MPIPYAQQLRTCADTPTFSIVRTHSVIFSIKLWRSDVMKFMHCGIVSFFSPSDSPFARAVVVVVVVVVEVIQTQMNWTN
jgi:hypothetical protein